MRFKFSFFAYGILAVCALSLVLAFSSAQTGLEEWANNFFYLSLNVGDELIVKIA